MTVPDLAVIDATRHDTHVPIDRRIACLPALERSLRLADISGCDAAWIAVAPTFVDRARELADATDADLDVSIHETEADSPQGVLQALESELDRAFREGTETLTYLRSTTAYFRNLPGDCLEHVREHGGIAVFRPADEPIADLLVADAKSWAMLSDARIGESGAGVAELARRVRDHFSGRVVAELDPDRAWSMPLRDGETAERAGDRIWQDCRKPTDGPVSEHFNRHVTLPISRQLGRLDVSPNVVSGFAFLAGLIGGLVGTIGGYFGFLAAGIIYKLNSLIDGFDGELARGKYEFSDFGAWVDKFCDDTSDIFFVAGAGYGAYSSAVAAPGSFGPQFWLWVVGTYLVGKTLCSSAFYSIPFFEGELVHPYGFFDWWFEETKDQEAKSGAAAQVFAGLKVLTKNDVFVAIALLCAVAGVLPWFLVVFAVGQVGVGINRILQVRWQLERNRASQSASASSSTASAGGE